MKYMNKSITELNNLLKSNDVTPTDLIKESLSISHEVGDKCNAFVTILDDAKESIKNDNILNNIPYGIKSNYSTKDVKTLGLFQPFGHISFYMSLRNGKGLPLKQSSRLYQPL